MKKFFVILASILIAFAVSSCKCTRDEDPVVEFPEATIAADRVKMDEEVSTYKWFETRVEYDNFFDADTTLTVSWVESLFQVAIEDPLGIKTFVYDFVHKPGVENDTIPEPIEGFILDDEPLNDELITLTFSEALARLNAANLPKPHSTKVVLRKAVGPKLANVQYIFGNTEEQVFVDAVTGDVTDHDPVIAIAE